MNFRLLEQYLDSLEEEYGVPGLDIIVTRAILDHSRTAPTLIVSQKAEKQHCLTIISAFAYA